MREHAQVVTAGKHEHVCLGESGVGQGESGVELRRTLEHLLGDPLCFPVLPRPALQIVAAAQVGIVGFAVLGRPGRDRLTLGGEQGHVQGLRYLLGDLRLDSEDLPRG